MRYYDYMAPAVNFMGPGCIEVLGERIRLLGVKKPLLVTDTFLNEMEDGPVMQAAASLKHAGIDYAVFTGVEPNPKVQNCLEGLKVYIEEGCDSIITVGGGSSHDCGKGIGIAATHEKPLTEYAGIETLTSPLPPIIAVNTTAGTASEVTRHCVLTNLDTHLKFVIVSWRNVPLVSINDPLLMLGVPKALTAATGMDALTHAVEAYVSVDANPVTDAAAIQAVKLAAGNLRQAVANGQNQKARENMAYASLLAGMAFNNANLGYVHAMAHQLGGQYDMPHGVANAILLPVVEEYNLNSAPERFADLAGFLGENTDGMSVMEAAQKAVDAMRNLAADVGIPKTLKEMGVLRQDFELMAENALLDGNAFSNPRKGTKEDIIGLFEKAYE
ncbi:iron-containing alcohol dehydrogenase [Anaerostipes sp.]|uniref:iron-containing alcohol dehydrogenase n=1 Tax=Anaerostipes sp. TaxID=1872530 RepID=UPI0025C04C6E|nr:iron-containing alcohol dehydrogenase [Anaerostipes sp.]MBS7009193.1 iron-containing alcohol dehydrogenase [Anaerostipes sp.]